ncbi:unnamed protein product [Caenorhabditis angaria]|uniref:Serine aminopeptidase S33 domain-containing protein n=1 Tax=Caenorhabditis angaria TaxID=860376 RepID=A0A9P1IUC3_9PELO|nr:unnamed protein product [Caenorhabditis angaria]
MTSQQRQLRYGEQEEHQPGCFEIFCGVLRACGLICYVACPPIPSKITNKLAFHPPRKGLTYRIVSKNEPQRKIENISEVKDNDYQLIIHNLANRTDFIYMEREVEVFTAETVFKNHLVCVKCKLLDPPLEESLQDQVILFCQPNSSDLGGFLQPSMMNLVSYANHFQVDMFAFDYSGYGYSSGYQCEKNVYADIRAVYQKIRETHPNKNIVLMGYSIGTTAVIDLAAENPEGLVGVILVAPLTSGLRLVSAKPADPKTCWADSFKSYDKIGNIETRVLICHGNVDEVIPLSHGMALYDKLKNPVPPSVIHGADHQTILNGRHYQTFDRISYFLKNETTISNRSTEVMTSQRIGFD